MLIEKVKIITYQRPIKTSKTRIPEKGVEEYYEDGTTLVIKMIEDPLFDGNQFAYDVVNEKVKLDVVGDLFISRINRIPEHYSKRVGNAIKAVFAQSQKYVLRVPLENFIKTSVGHEVKEKTKLFAYNTIRYFRHAFDFNMMVNPIYSIERFNNNERKYEELNRLKYLEAILKVVVGYYPIFGDESVFEGPSKAVSTAITLIENHLNNEDLTS